MSTTYNEYCFDIGKALKERGRLEAQLAQLQKDKIKWLKAALLTRWFTEGYYDKWASYFRIKASICRLKKEIASNKRKIVALESRLAAFGVPASTESGEEDDCVDVDAEVVPDDDPNVTYYQNDGLNAGTEDAD